MTHTRPAETAAKRRQGFLAFRARLTRLFSLSLGLEGGEEAPVLLLLPPPSCGDTLESLLPEEPAERRHHSHGGKQERHRDGGAACNASPREPPELRAAAPGSGANKSRRGRFHRLDVNVLHAERRSWVTDHLSGPGFANGYASSVEERTLGGRAR